MQAAAGLGRARALPALIVVALAAAVAGCGSSSTSKTQTRASANTQTSAGTSSSSSGTTSSPTTSAHGATGITKAQAAKAYLALSRPVQTTGNAFGASLNASDTGQQVAAKAKPLLAAYKIGDAKLLVLARHYPPAAADIRTMVKINRAVVADLQDAGQISAATQGQWGRRFARDARRASAQISIVHSDLGLTPQSG